MHSPTNVPSPADASNMQQENTPKCWLIKAEPDSRVVKGRDVKFSIDDFESVRSTPWEGVRNYEARNLMKEMVLGDKLLFYHSNCKNPGIAGFAEVSKEAYPDDTAWDSAHPYFDEKSDYGNPTWFMVDAKFISRARHFVPLSILRYLANLPSDELPEAIGYVGKSGVNAIKGIVPWHQPLPYERVQPDLDISVMPLITRGRLSVQRVPAECWDVIRAMADKGGWDGMSFEKKKDTKKPPIVGHRTARRSTRRRDGVVDTTQPRGSKRKMSACTSPEDEPRRRSLRKQLGSM